MTLDTVLAILAIASPFAAASVIVAMIYDHRAAKARRSTVTLLGPGAAMAARRARR